MHENDCIEIKEDICKKAIDGGCCYVLTSFLSFGKRLGPLYACLSILLCGTRWTCVLFLDHDQSGSITVPVRPMCKRHDSSQSLWPRCWGAAKEHKYFKIKTSTLWPVLMLTVNGNLPVLRTVRITVEAPYHLWLNYFEDHKCYLVVNVAYFLYNIIG